MFRGVVAAAAALVACAPASAAVVIQLGPNVITGTLSGTCRPIPGASFFDCNATGSNGQANIPLSAPLGVAVQGGSIQLTTVGPEILYGLGIGSPSQAFVSGNSTTNVPFFLSAGMARELIIFTARADAEGPFTTTYTFTLNGVSVPIPPVVPEPATWAMMIGGFGVVGAMARRGRRTSSSHSTLSLS